MRTQRYKNCFFILESPVHKQYAKELLIMIGKQNASVVKPGTKVNMNRNREEN